MASDSAKAACCREGYSSTVCRAISALHGEREPTAAEEAAADRAYWDDAYDYDPDDAGDDD
ncbi:hypothetical protein ACFWIB_15280 [Streptomyces sp. NPDC127051]|uniref:hypothetical protein n=1 Tax=Streptomyces sp. NPDC127051 TaxID=3347119 RepID=UPI003655D543